MLHAEPKPVSLYPCKVTLADICCLFFGTMCVCTTEINAPSKVCLSQNQIVFIWHVGINTSLCIVLLSVCVLKNCIFHTEAVQCKRRCVRAADKSRNFSLFFFAIVDGWQFQNTTGCLCAYWQWYRQARVTSMENDCFNVLIICRVRVEKEKKFLVLFFFPAQILF